MSGLLDRKLNVFGAPKGSTRDAASTRAHRGARMGPLMREDLTVSDVRAARAVAVAADVLQVVLLPTFFPAALPPVNDVIDFAVAVVLVRLLGWHWAFLPAFLAEAVPLLDLAPTWTAAVFLATRGLPVAARPPEVVVEPPPSRTEPRALPGDVQAPRGPSGA
jgi:hypothetical protein